MFAFHLPLVSFMWHRMSVSDTGWPKQDDLEGVWGIDAIDRYDPSRGVSFNTFAFPRIRGAILDELRRYDWFSRSARDKIQRLEKAIEILAEQGNKIDDEELMKKLGMDEKELKELYELMSRSFVISLDEVISLEEGEVERGALIPDSSPSRRKCRRATMNMRS